MKYVLNKCFGGFGLSKEVYSELGIAWDGYGYLDNKRLGIESDDYMAYRSDPRLVAAVEKLGTKTASGAMAELAIVDIPDGMDIEWDEYDGIESIHEAHKSW